MPDATAQDGPAELPSPAAPESVLDPYASTLARVDDPATRQRLVASLALGPRLTTSEIREVMAKWRGSTGGPADGPSWLLAARLWRQAGVPDSAVESLRRASASDDLPRGLLSLEAARTAFMAGRADAARAYREGCDRPAPEVLEEYWRDFAALATPAEAAEWSALDSLSADARSDGGCALLRRAWARRAARTGSSVARRLALHYERLRYARKHYYIVGSTGAERLGPRTRLLSVQVGRPGASGLDDRGLLYVRLGLPDRTASFSGIQNEARRKVRVEVVVSPTCYHPNVTWAYEFPDGVRLYHLSPLEGSANWWLLENLYDLYRCGDPSVVGAGTVLTPAAENRSAPIGQIAWLVLPDLYLSRSGLDPAYATLSHRIVSSGPSSGQEMDGLRSLSGGALGLQQDFDDERRTSFSTTEDVLTEGLARPEVLRELPLIYAVLQFRTPATTSGERTRVWLNALVRGEELEPEALGDGSLEYEIEATFSALGEASGLRQRTASVRLETPHELGEDGGVPVRIALDLPPGGYEYSVVVRDGNDDRTRPAGNWVNDSLRVRRYGAKLPQLSDIAFAPDSGGTWSPAPGVSLPVTPVNVTDESGHAWLYFEVYGLSPRGEYVTEIRLEPRGDGEPFTLTYSGPPQASSEEPVRRLLRLDLGITEPGEYEATISVTDDLGRRSLPIETSLVVR